MNRYFKAMLSMIFIFILGFFNTNVLAEKNCVEVPVDKLAYASMFPIPLHDLTDKFKPFKTRDGIIYAKKGKNGKIQYRYEVYNLNATDKDGKPIPLDKKSIKTGIDARDAKGKSEYYDEGGMGNKTIPEEAMPKSKVSIEPGKDGKEVLVLEGEAEPMNNFNWQNLNYLDKALRYVNLCEQQGKTPKREVLQQMYRKNTNNNESKEAKKYEQRAVDLAMKGTKAISDAVMDELYNANAIVSYRVDYPPQKICDDDTPEAERACAEWNKDLKLDPVTCDDGTATGYKAPCIIEKTKDLKSSYTTSTPDNSDPWMINWTSICDNQMPGYLQFSQIMNPFGDRSYTNPQILNNGINNFNKKKPMDKFDNNYWKTSYRGEGREIREWNPFVDGNKLSGIPYKVLWTKNFDGWYDNVYSINPIITDSINHVKEMEANNTKIASIYNQSGDKFKVFLKAPNKSMDVTTLNLNTNTWDKAKTTNANCLAQYWVKVEPRYILYRHDLYQKYDWHHNIEPSYNYRCKCVEEEAYEACAFRNVDGTCDRYETRYRCIRDELEKYTIGVNEKYPGGETTETHEDGSRPPIYKQRRTYQYRKGALVEYHAMTRPYGKTTMIPVPKSKDTSKMKSGYGFGYTSGVQMITDYDRAPSTYKFNPVIIRPNKATNLNIRTNNYKSSYGLFDSNVHYDKAKNAPERSSSIDKTFIEETLSGGLTKTTFKPSVISNVEKVDGKAKDFTEVERVPVKSSMVRKTAVKWGEMTSTFKISSNPAKYYHAYWKTKGEPNLIPAYKPGPLHYVYLDYPSGSDYTVASLDTINLNGKGFFATGMNTGSIKIVGNMWEDSFSRPNFKK